MSDKMHLIRGRGRPPLLDGEVSVSVNVRMPASVADRAYALARKERTTLPALIRAVLLSRLTDDPTDRQQIRTRVWVEGGDYGPLPSIDYEAVRVALRALDGDFCA